MHHTHTHLPVSACTRRFTSSSSNGFSAARCTGSPTTLNDNDTQFKNNFFIIYKIHQQFNHLQMNNLCLIDFLDNQHHPILKYEIFFLIKYGFSLQNYNFWFFFQKNKKYGKNKHNFPLIHEHNQHFLQFQNYFLVLVNLLYIYFFKKEKYLVFF